VHVLNCGFPAVAFAGRKAGGGLAMLVIDHRYGRTALIWPGA